ncbi:MAG TPA: hydantoinase/oxoprolinase family protein [Candidatus Cybelea sp.]|nr:hydantoinase/oxoprolinase family protein [Candidatus Cybelea sp.]
MRRALRVGIDVGGTFTDLAAVESWSGCTLTRKVASTPREPQRAVARALLEMLGAYEELPAIELLAHSTTIATNALLGQIGLELPRVAVVTTRGFADVIEIGRQNRSEVYNLFVTRPRPLVAREDRLTVDERIDYKGAVLRPLRDEEIARACAALRERNVAAVAICLLHSYANDAHERRLAQAISAALPLVRVTRSSDVDPQYREYERCSTTVVNAVLAPIVETYLERLVAELRANGVTAPLYVMRSDGGLAAAARVVSRPAALIESGPAGGAVAAAALGRALRIGKLLSFDMGGTTAKAGAIVDGIAQVTGEFEAAGRTHSGRAVSGSGYPVRYPFVDLAEVSAGGGTIAWLDDAGVLHTGPLSAGADPGPACYGHSDRATVTDANVVLGRLNPRALLGGAFPISAQRARDAVERIARRLHLGVEAAAAGIVRLADDAMAKALRIVTIERGLDPREFTLVAFGGGGPLHACAVAEELGIARAIVPPHPGLFSAFGLLDAELRENELLAVMRPASQTDYDALGRWFVAMETAMRSTLIEQGANPDAIAFVRRFDARYRGQSFELPIEAGATAAEVESAFAQAHRTRYGYDVSGEPVEIVNARVAGAGRLPARSAARAAEGEPAPCDGAGRTLWTGERFVEAPVVDRTTVREDERIDGPAIVEEYDSTTYVAPGWSLRRDGAMLMLEQR